MNLIIGGYAQGTLRYVQQKYGFASCKVWDGELPDNVREQQETVIINHFHNWVMTCMIQGGSPEEEILKFIDKCPKCVIISDEIGNGIVPVEAFEREYRERTGRILIELARKAQEVERVICGIGQKIK